MTLPAVSIAVRSPSQVAAALGQAAAAARSGAKLVEWRLDGLAVGPDAAAVAGGLLAESPLPAIVTVRGRAEGGDYSGSEEDRAGLLATLIRSDQPPRYVDLELASYEGNPVVRRRIDEALEDGRRGRDAHASLILSAHDLDRRPVDLLQKIERMTAEPACSIVKVAWTARSVRDNLEAFDLLHERTKPTIALCMGRFGLMSRLLAGKFGGFLTYAAAGEGGATAAGQPTLDELRDVYRVTRVGAATKVYGVVGWPVEHSAGPFVHNAWFEAAGVDGVYVPIPIPPEYEHFKASVGSLVDHPRLDLGGLSVTIPHKENLTRFVGERGGAIEPQAERIGAANTLAVEPDGALACLNTDAPAAVGALCSGLGIETAGLAGVRIAVLGAGGVARAVAAGLSDAGASVMVFNRNPERATALAEALGGETAHVVAGTPDALGCGRFDVFVNCTPVGMADGPAPDDSPLADDVELGPGVAVFDTVYVPAETPLLRRAAAAGATIVGGRDMFRRQAALQFERWTGREPTADS